MEQEIFFQDAEECKRLLAEHSAVAVYFSTPDCNVCKTLKPKVMQMLADEFPRMKFCYVNIAEHKALGVSYNIFTVPVIVLFFEGKEGGRKTRSFSLAELAGEINRPYSLLFD